ncbi:MAG TPA: pyridoxal phosphate-dependent aminotransferase [Verrucomicrobiales bacterium]|jgi:aspartate aminotransferase|nr:pyridoxal phosphate-dependent aminotransferase [Verrucomicrobiales bacterium]
MDFVASKIAELSPSITLAVTSQAAKMKKEGIDVCSFGAGEPDMDTPQHIKDACVKALAEGKTKYTASAGLLELREAICAKLLVDNNLEYTPGQISVNCGAKHSCFNAILACCSEGDEVIIPAPYWTSYPDMVRMAGAIPVIVETKQENGWKMTPEEFEEAMSPATKMVILNSPSNPTGAVYSKEELEKIAEIAAGEDILILSDEIYEKLVYDETPHVSIASLSKEMKDLTIVVNGFSKAYSMTGWRLGYTAAPKKIADAIDTIQSHTTSAPATFAQWGALAALQGDPQIIEDMRMEFDMRRGYMMGRFSKLNQVSVVEPKGAFYFLVNIGKMGIKSLNFAEKLLSRMHVAVVPGIAFGADDTVRFSYACSLDVIKKGLDRFEEFCRAH